MQSDIIIWEFIKNVEQLIEHEVSSKSLLPASEDVFYWKHENLKYTNRGLVSDSGEGIIETRQNWLVIQHYISKLIRGWDKAFQLEDALANLRSGEEDPQKIVLSVYWQIAGAYFYSIPEKREAAYNQIVQRFIRDLEGGPQTIAIKIELTGIILEPDSILISETYLLRKPIREDIEVPVDITSRATSIYQNNFKWPTAILEGLLHNEHINPQELQEDIDKLLIVLRLWSSGNIDFLRYTISGDRVVGERLQHGINNAYKQSSELSYLVPSNKEREFKSFFNVLFAILPLNMYGSKKNESSITIALDRYTEAACEAGSLERKITNIMMGLEALFSTDGVEIAYKLRLRVAKFLSVFDKPALQMAELLKKGYDIRSKFSHGSILKIKEKTEYTKDSQFLVSLLDMLRLAIVAFIVLNLEKEEIIRLLDKAMINDQENERLNELSVKFEKRMGEGFQKANLK